MDHNYQNMEAWFVYAATWNNEAQFTNDSYLVAATEMKQKLM